MILISWRRSIENGEGSDSPWSNCLEFSKASKANSTGRSHFSLDWGLLKLDGGHETRDDGPLPKEENRPCSGASKGERS
jgi:hypothetical protein